MKRECTKKVLGIALLTAMAWLVPSEGRADTPEQIFDGIKIAIDQFKSEKSRFVKKWPKEATTDEALMQLAQTMATCKEVRELNLFTNREKHDEIAMNRIRNKITVGIASRKTPIIRISGTLRPYKEAGRDYSIDAKYRKHKWSLKGWIQGHASQWSPYGSPKTTNLNFEQNLEK